MTNALKKFQNEPEAITADYTSFQSLEGTYTAIHNIYMARAYRHSRGQWSSPHCFYYYYSAIH